MLNKVSQINLAKILADKFNEGGDAANLLI